MEQVHEVNMVIERESDRFSAPSTSQLLNRECNVESEKLLGMPNSTPYEEKFTHTNITVRMHGDREMIAVEASKADECNSAKETYLSAERENSDFENMKTKKKKSYAHSCSCLNNKRDSRRNLKVDWTRELHRNFVKAVEQLGIDQAFPSKILELMKVKNLTRHNVASHLQKFRMRRRRILPKEDHGSWGRDCLHPQRNCMQEQQPVMAFPSHHSNYAFPASCQVYPIWPHQTYLHKNVVHMWGHSGLPTWHGPPDYGQYNTYTEMPADAWGFPVLPHYSYGQYYMPPQSPAMMNCVTLDQGMAWKSSSHVCLAEETIDESLKEVMSKPWLPLPLGLKPPPTDKIIAELHQLGIHTIPPLPNRCRS